jgi:flagellar hook-associated protein 2
MASIQFTGLASGLDTVSIISSLMDVEKIPQTTLKNKLATKQSEVSALQQINTALAALSTSAKSFATGSTWTQLSATSSNSAVSVTASSSAVPASFALTVNRTAAAAQTSITASTLASASGTLTITGSDGSAKATFAAGSSLSDIASSINAATKTNGLQAHVVKDAVGGSVLLITSTATGAASNFSITQSDGTDLVAATTNGVDASVSLGGGVEVTSSTNTFTNLMDGIDVTLAAGTASGTTSNVSVAADGASRATAMKAFISQLNDVLSQLSQVTAYGTITDGSASTGGGMLPGDTTLRSVADQLVNTVFPGGTSSLANFGVSIDRYGQFTFDSDKFTAAYAADPEGVQAAMIGSGSFSDRVQKVADLASDAYDGSISGYITNENSEIKRYTDQIADWDDRLTAKQASLQQIYTNLTTALATMQSQQTWLTSQIESLDSLFSSK